MKEAEDDQALFTVLLLKRPELIALDYEQKLIETMHGVKVWMDASLIGMQKCKNLNIRNLKLFQHFFIFKESFMNVTGNSHVSLATLVTCVENLLMLLKE